MNQLHIICFSSHKNSTQASKYISEPQQKRNAPIKSLQRRILRPLPFALLVFFPLH